MKEFSVDIPCKLSDFLYKNCFFSFDFVKQLLRNKDIKVNGIRVKNDVNLNVGDSVFVYVKEQEFKVLYSDDNIVAYYKPKGILSEGENSLESTVNKDGKLFLMHRLDAGTDGILLFAKNKEAYDELYKAFKNRYLDKYYYALVVGEIKSQSGLIISYLLKDEKSGFVKASLFDNGGEKALTEYKVVKSEGEVSELEIKLLTGKTHQIRASLPLIGMYIIGDGKYGKKEINEKYKKHKQQLTFVRLEFNFPKGSMLQYLNEIVISI